MNPIHIVVYRKLGKDADLAFKETLERLYIYDIDGCYNTYRKVIDVGDYITFSFRSGDLDKMAGLRCDAFNSDSWYGDRYLYTRLKNDKITNPNIRDLDDFVDKMIEVLKVKEETDE